jgi:predicted nuclease of restriction endonuclease-like (RecB) superfamily
MARKKKQAVVQDDYAALVTNLSALLDQARRASARAVNGILTVAYWEIGRRIVEFEQGGHARAGYGEELLDRLGEDLARRHGRGFSPRNLRKMRSFYLGWEIWPTVSAKWEGRVRLPEGAAAGRSALAGPVDVVAASFAFPLPWSHYVRLLSVESPQARAFYEAESIRGGWSVRQLDRQVSTRFYERVMASKRPEALREKGQLARPEDAVSPEEEVRDPYILEFLNLKDEYSESELEDALIRHLETFMLELGAGFTFVARQKNILIDHVWYKMDLVFFHRGLKALIILDLKIGAFTAADAGQMNLYLNYAREHLMMPGEAEPVGIILCSEKNDAVVKYATGGINTKVFASTYLANLPDAETLRQELLRTKRAIEMRAGVGDVPKLPGPKPG